MSEPEEDTGTGERAGGGIPSNIAGGAIGGIISGGLGLAALTPLQISLPLLTVFGTFFCHWVYYSALISSANTKKRSADRRKYLAFRKQLTEGGAVL